MKSAHDCSPHHFQYYVSSKQTPANLLLNNTDRYNSFQLHDRIEICPEAATITRNVCEFLKEQQGSALFIDYGHDKIQSDSLRVFF